MFQSIGYGVTSDQHLNKFSGYYYGGTVSKSTIMIINDNSFVLDGLIAIMKKKGTGLLLHIIMKTGSVF